MPSLVEELQRDALNKNISVTELLQKCLVLATKLEIDEFASWARLELDGYIGRNVPAYRVIHGEPQVFNPYHGYQPMFFEDPDDKEFISKMPFNQPIGEIDHLLAHANKAGSGNFSVSFAPANEKNLIDMMGLPMKPSLRVSTSHMHGILDAVRKVILEWSIKLESDGILGEGMSFSREEKEKAHSVTYNIKNYIHGNIDHSQIQVESANSFQKGSFQDVDLFELKKIISSLKKSLDDLGIEGDIRDELISEIHTLEAQTDSPKPKASILRESLISVRKILESAAGNLVASGLLSQIGKFFGP
jgi:hypothetical protein